MSQREFFSLKKEVTSRNEDEFYIQIYFFSLPKSHGKNSKWILKIRMNPDINYEPRVVMCYGRGISHKVPTALVRGEDDGGDHVCGGEGIQESSVPFSLFCYDS